jgi:hypothetical protein
MNYVKVVNKAEILLYSTLISIMSGINRQKDRASESDHAQIEDIEAPSGRVKVIGSLAGKSALITWEAVQQSFLSLLLWIILGLAAGFLIGMLQHG